jgi:hypothetical protein
MKGSYCVYLQDHVVGGVLDFEAEENTIVQNVGKY